MVEFTYAYLYIINVSERHRFPRRYGTYILFVYTGDGMENRSVGREGGTD